MASVHRTSAARQLLQSAGQARVRPSSNAAIRLARQVGTASHASTVPSTTFTARGAPRAYPAASSQSTVGEASTARHETAAAASRFQKTKPFSDFLTDKYSRQHDYLRISLTERCNLRCTYCMPEEGVPLSPEKELLTTPEIVLLSSVFVSQGVTKIRLTGGEPTVRKDILPLMHQLGALRRHGLREICLTTNGIALHRKLESMVEAGLTGVNISLDTLDPYLYQVMTRRDGFSLAWKSINRVMELNRVGAGIKLKVNCVMMRNVNDQELLPFVELTRENDIEVRFIEYMPFDGNKWNKGKMFPYQSMLDEIRKVHPTLRRVEGHKNDTSKTFHVPGFAGTIGFITSMTENFCGTCNRLRITSDGNLKVCLFGNAEVSLRDIVRRTNDGQPIDKEAFEIMKRRALAGTENHGVTDVDSSFVFAPNSQELLDTIGMAVKRKAKAHAGIGQLENMKNRPMILIDSMSRSHKLHQLRDITHPLLSSSPPSSRMWPYPRMLTSSYNQSKQLRYFSRTNRHSKEKDDSSPAAPNLTHVSPSGSARMVSIASKPSTSRVAVAACTVHFSNAVAATLIRENQMKKGDVLGVARVAGIMASKRTPDLIPLCHPIAISHVSVDLEIAGGTTSSGERASLDDRNSRMAEGSSEASPDHGRVEVRATVECDGKTGVEMEALTGASMAALTIYDMCKAVDKGMRIDGLRVVLKDGGKSGRWVEGKSSE